MGTEEKVTKNEIRPIVMSVTVVLFIALLAAIVINADAFYDFLYNAVMNNAMWGLGWFTSLVCLFMVIVCVVILVTPMGKIRLGGPNAKPKFTYLQWFGISLCTGIGAGVVFWGAAEPLLFAMEPDTHIESQNLKYPLNGLAPNRWWQATLNESLATTFTLTFPEKHPLLIYKAF